MFEKEAKKYSHIECVSKHIKSISSDESINRRIHNLVSLVYIHAAEFGYNKANKWHNLEKNPNDLPKENHFVFICNARFGYSVARYAPFNEYCCKTWVTNENTNIPPEKVFAWCEIHTRVIK